MPKKKTSTHRGRRHSSTKKVPPRPSPPHSPAPRPARASTVAYPRLLTIDEVAELLRTTRGAIYAQIRRGALPGVIRLSRRLLVDGNALLDWLDDRRAVSLTTRGNQR